MDLALTRVIDDEPNWNVEIIRSMLEEEFFRDLEIHNLLEGLFAFRSMNLKASGPSTKKVGDKECLDLRIRRAVKQYNWIIHQISR